MVGKIFLFTGEDHFRLHEELKRWRTQFAEKYGNDSVVVFDVHADVVTIAHAVSGGWLFSSQQCVVVYGLPWDTYAINKKRHQDIDILLPLLSWLPDSVLLVLVSYKPDKRTSAYKHCSSLATLKEFKMLEGSALRRYVSDISQDFLSDDLLDYFLACVGVNDLYCITHELGKLRDFSTFTGRPLSKDDVDMIVFSRGESNNFAFLDKVFSDPQQAIALLSLIEGSGTSWMLFCGALYRWLKILIQMIVLYSEGKTTTTLLAQEIGAPPFTVGRYMKSTELLVRDRVKVYDLYTCVLSLDYRIKTGQLPDSAFWGCLKSAVYELGC